MFLGLRTVVYHVSNLDEAKRWYSKVSGVEPYFDEPFYVGFNVGGFELGLAPSSDPASAPASQPESPAGTSAVGAVAYWGVKSCQSAFDALVANGATSEQPPQEVGGGIVVAHVRDPWGNVLGVIENPHFKREDVR